MQRRSRNGLPSLGGNRGCSTSKGRLRTNLVVLTAINRSLYLSNSKVQKYFDIQVVSKERGVIRFVQGILPRFSRLNEAQHPLACRANLNLKKERLLALFSKDSPSGLKKRFWNSIDLNHEYQYLVDTRQLLPAESKKAAHHQKNGFNYNLNQQILLTQSWNTYQTRSTHQYNVEPYFVGSTWNPLRTCLIKDVKLSIRVWCFQPGHL